MFIAEENTDILVIKMLILYIKFADIFKMTACNGISIVTVIMKFYGDNDVAILRTGTYISTVQHS
jgi:hypothetical protein